MPPDSIGRDMPSVADAPLADLSRRADPETVTAFVADLQEARGWNVDRRGDRRLLLAASGAERRVGVVHPDDGPATDLVDWADTVVAPDGTAIAGDADVEILDATALGRQLAYALDRSLARDLLRSHFGWRPPPEPAPDERTGTRTDDGTAGGPSLVASRLFRPGVGRPQMLLAAVVVLVVAAGIAVVAAEQLGGGPLDGTGEGAAAETPMPVADVATPTPTPEAETPTSEGVASEVPLSVDEQYRDSFGDLPPGLAQSGAIDRATLVDAHGSVLENRSYRLTLAYREARNGRPTGVHTETIRVVNNTRYSASVTRHGTLQAPVPAIAETDVYADGSARFEHTNGSVQQGVIISYDRFLAGHTRFLAVFMDVTESSIADYRVDNGTATAFVVTDGNRASLIEEARGSFDVREDGLVRRARWSYGFSPQLTGYTNLTATFALRVTDIGSTTVDRPGWLNETAPGPANGTDGSATENGTDGGATDEGTPTPGTATPSG